MKQSLPTLIAAKADAKRLRAEHASQGDAITHAQSLEQVARTYGYRDWNTFQAAIRACPVVELMRGAAVTGQYLTHPFSAIIRDVTQAEAGWRRITLDLDEPIDVIKFDSFSNFRKRITGVIGPNGHSREKTSDGAPVLQVDV